MTPREFHLNPADYGLPTRDELVDLRIWDSHFHGFYGAASDPVAQYRANNFYVERMGIERSISLEIGGTLATPPHARALRRRTPRSPRERPGPSLGHHAH